MVVEALAKAVPPVHEAEVAQDALVADKLHALDLDAWVVPGVRGEIWMNGLLLARPGGQHLGPQLVGLRQRCLRLPGARRSGRGGPRGSPRDLEGPVRPPELVSGQGPLALRPEGQELVAGAPQGLHHLLQGPPGGGARLWLRVLLSIVSDAKLPGGGVLGMVEGDARQARQLIEEPRGEEPPVDQGDVVHRLRHDARRGRDGVVPRMREERGHAAGRGLQRADAAEGRRDAQGAADVAADAERRGSASYERPLAAAAAAGSPQRVPGIQRVAEGGTAATPGLPHLRHVCLREGDRPQAPEDVDQRLVLPRPCGTAFLPASFILLQDRQHVQGHWRASGLHVVLDRERHAMQGP
mmetsp:Transcript_5975/g.17135  ORF Transcript_5975/g.17135 Transcript_5975/m.17135 type:complete len:354 (-) Transcript_5975:306-1367(-)